MEHSKLNRIIAGSVFALTLIVYVKTLSDTVVFWDVGEFIAAAFYMQVPHPPGSPLFLLVTRLFMLIPFAQDLAVRAHFVSALCSALTVTFLYLTIVKLIMLWKEKPATLIDKLVFYASAVIGAFSLAFSPTFWFNAVEAEVYGASMFFIGGITYLALRWNERADQPGNEKYIFGIAYFIGLSLGVHLLALLVIFPFLMIIYFRRYEFSIMSFLKFGIVAVVIFGIVYPGIVKFLPNLLDGEVTLGGELNKSVLWTLIPIVIIGAAIYGVYYSVVHKRKMLNVALLSFLFIVLGYSTYVMVIIRANAGTPMNENNPNNLSRLVSYLNREQYGEAPLMKRRWSNEPQHQGMYTKYTSDGDYLWRYQIDHMFLRYFLWQYVGVEGDWQDAGVNWKQLYGIPLLFGLIGLVYHFKKDRNMWFVFMAFFLLMGFILTLYFNMQEPQPRERDYFFVGAFFVFSMWIGIGVFGLIETIRELLQNEHMKTYAASGVLLLSFVFVPGNMMRTNYHGANRTGDYVAWDYSYNLLQSCEPDGILFTNGDNDTFPLWYLQDVEGVRRDIRIVNLSLVNTPWYIMQLKHGEPYGSKKVPISIPDAQIENIQPIQWQPREMTLDVPRDVIDQYTYTTDVNKQVSLLDTSVVRTGKLRFVLPYTMSFGDMKAIRVQDILAYDIISTNKWKRPIYFAVTSTPDSKIGLDKFFRMDGLAMKLIPYQASNDEGIIVDSILTANMFNEPAGFSKTFRRGYKFRGLKDSTVYFDENVTRLIMNYRNAYLRLTLHHLNTTKNFAKALEALDSMETKIPRKIMPIDYRLMFDIASFYNYAGDKQKHDIFLNELEEKLNTMVEKNPHEALNQYNPYTMLLAIYEGRQDFEKAIDILNRINTIYAGTPGLDQQIKDKIAQLQAQLSLMKSFKKDSVAMESKKK